MKQEIIRKEIKTDRLTVSYIEEGNIGNPLLILIHGNTSSNVFFWENIKVLSKEFHVIAPDLRGFGRTERVSVDASKGVRVWSEDICSFLTALNIQKKPHLLGWSLGGGVVMQYAIDYPESIASISLINPLSPYGYSCTKDAAGTLANDRYSGTGSSLINPNFVVALKDKITDSTNPSAAPTVLNTLFAQGYQLDSKLAEVFMEGMFDMAIGEDFYPGNALPCDVWPFMAPGDKGICNTMSPKYTNLSSIVDISPKPPILWFRGEKDRIVSNACLVDTGFLGSLGIIPGWPGMEIYPPQPMITQTRTVLDSYAANGGDYEEYVFPNAGHSPNIENFDEFNKKLSSFIKGVDNK